MRKRLIGVVDGLGLFLAFSLPPHAAGDMTGNLLANPSFEEDWINAKAEKQLISNWGEHGFGQSDLKPDAWRYPVPVNPDERTIFWDAGVAHSGSHSVRMEAKSAAGKAAPSAYQDQLYAAYQGEPGKDVFDSDRKSWQPVGITLSAADAPRFFRKVRLSAWCKAENVPEGARIGVSFGVSGSSVLALNFPVGTYDWQKQETEIWATQLHDAFVKALGGKTEGQLPQSRRLTLQFSPAGKSPSGTAWFDDVCVEEELPSTRNLVDDPSFEEPGLNLIPNGWSNQRKFLHVPPSWYYVWRDWSHFFSPPRGQVAVDSLIARSGHMSFRFSVLPGDEKYCESGPISVGQDSVRPLEIGVWLKADRIRYFDLRAVDENGVYLNDVSFITSTHDRESGAEYRGTFDWRYFRKFLVSNRPLKTVRVRLCARGFNGLNVDDVGRKATNNQVGTLWWDDLLVTDPLGKPNWETAVLPQRPAVHVSNIDFGERLYGRNTARVTVVNLSQAACEARVLLSLHPPAGTPPDSDGTMRPTTYAKVAVPPSKEGTILLPYELVTMCPDWRSQCRLGLTVSVGNFEPRFTELDFGTWPEIGRAEMERVFAHPAEAKNQHVWVNFGVTEATLSEVGALRFDVVRVRMNKVVKSFRIKDFQRELYEFRKTQPLMDWWVDESRLFRRTLDLSFLPVHPQDRPVRDHKLVVVAEEGGLFGKELFRCESVPFGLVEPNTEKLDPVASVEVRNGATYVNGKPLFLRGCLGHSWGNEPAPSQRQPWLSTSKTQDNKTVHGFSSVKAHGFNAFWPNTPYGLDYADSIWRANLYTAVWYPQGWGGLAFDDRLGEPWKCKSPLSDFEAAAKHPSMLLVSLTAWEGGMPDAVYLDQKLLKAQAEFADQIRQATGRPLFSSGGYSAHKQQYGTMWDVFGPESNWDGPSRVPVTALYPMRALGKQVAGVDFPNIFNDMAYDLIRFETYEGIIRGQRGFVQIGRWGDNTLYRGLNGELRYLEKFIFEPEGKPTLEVEPVDAENMPKAVGAKAERHLPKVSFMERTVGGTTYVIATNAQPICQGDWAWSEEQKFSGKRSHTGQSTFCRLHPDRLLDWHVHGYRDDKPVQIRQGDRILQYVFIPEDANIETLMLMVDGNGCWNHNAVWGTFDFERFSASKIRFRLTFELYRWLWSSISIPGNRQVWRDELYGDAFERDFLRAKDFRRIGDLPEKGKWARLEVPAEALGLVGKLTTGFEFVSKGGRVWWDYTAIERENEVLVLCDDVLGASEPELAQIRFSGCKPGARIAVPFEDRVLKADRQGTFVDDFRGENVYDSIWEGMLGDKIAPTVYYGGGYHYNYPKAAVHVYEIR
jgi:hypothetical protein